MEISQTKLLIFCLAFFVTGIALGAFYDISAVLPAIGGKTFCPEIRQRLSKITLPIIRRNLKASKSNVKEFTVGFTVFIHDLVFMVVSGIFVSIMIYRFNDGIWRFYAFIFIMIGFALYRVFLRYPVLVISEFLRFALKCMALYIIFLFCAPIKAVTVFLKAVILRCLNTLNIKKTQKFLIKYSLKEKERLKKSALYSGAFDLRNGGQNVRHKKEKQNDRMDDDRAFSRVGHSVDDQSYAI